MFWKKKKNTIKSTPDAPLKSSGGCGEGSCGCKETTTEQTTQEAPKGRGLNSVTNIIAISSGKGGVGKSTVTNNLAHALKDQGLRVGILDADIYGPSQAGMLGEAKGKPVGFDGLIRPLEKDGMKFISMANLNQGQDAIVWRAPLAINALEQFLHGVHWGELDYLLVDLPPGTGDIHLTFVQQTPIKAAIIVTTPQRVAVEVTKRGMNLFKQVNVPILGVVENMASFSCPSCHSETALSKKDYLSDILKDFKTEKLAKIPLDPEIMECSDEGVSVVKTHPDSASSTAFLKLAQNVIELTKGDLSVNLVEGFMIDETGRLKISLKDGSEKLHSPYQLRLDCKCALCVDEVTGEKLLDKGEVPLNIALAGAQQVGAYGISLNFSDGHNTGIYHVDALVE